MNNRFSPSPDPVSQQPVANSAKPIVMPVAVAPDAYMLPILIRFSLWALLATFVFVIAFRLTGSNVVSPSQTVHRTEPESPDSLRFAQQSSEGVLNTGGVSSVTQPGLATRATTETKVQLPPSGSKLLLLESGHFNSAARDALLPPPPVRPRVTITKAPTFAPLPQR